MRIKVPSIDLMGNMFHNGLGRRVKGYMDDLQSFRLENFLIYLCV